MNLLSVQGLSKAHGLKQLFSNVSLGIDDRDRIGVIGSNGSGKSTLLRILAGVEPPDAGSVARKTELRIEFLDQKPHFEPGRNVLEHVLAGENETIKLVRDYELAINRLETHPEDAAALKRVEDLSHRMDTLGGWEIESRAQTILSRLGIHDLDAEVETLSGGYRKRVALARALLTPCDLLILDEPTNHLDTTMIDWLEDYLRRFEGAVLLVTHDRYFLDRITRVIFEIERGALRRFEGNFSYYLERKAELEENEAASDQRLRMLLRSELAWMRRGARARRTKEKARIERFHDLKDKVVDRKEETLAFASGSRRLGGKILVLENVSKSFGEKTCVRGFSHSFTKGERLGIIGPNGCGKTTLVNLITGALTPDAGEIETGETVSIGYYDQESQGLDPDERALDYVKREGGEMLRAPDGETMTAEKVMERFLFTPQMLYAPIAKLSGGERRRLYLVKTLMRDPNFLILDEPTNDLDIPTLQALESYLDNFAGCVIVISHDRYFLDRTVEMVFAHAGDGQWEKIPGGYEVYAQVKAEREAAARAEADPRKAKSAAAATQAAQNAPTSQTSQSSLPARAASSQTAQHAAPAKPPAAKLSHKEQKELETTEAAISSGEARLAAIDGEMVAAASDYPKLSALAKERQERAAALEAAMARWEELATRADQAKKKN